MTTRASITPQEAFWNERKAGLKNARSKPGGRISNTPEGRPNGFKPLSSEHPLLARSRAKARQSPVGRHTRTPPARLTRIDTPPEHKRFQHDANVRNSKYGVIPPVHPKHNAFEREERPRSDGYDSWGEGGSDSEEERPGPPAAYAMPYPGMPLPAGSYPNSQVPMVMYPMVIPVQAPQLSTPYSKTKDGKPKKKVRYRETPIYMSSREHTKHTPAPGHRRPYQSPAFDYIAPTSTDRDPFDPRGNPILQRYSIGTPLEYKSRAAIAREYSEKHPDFTADLSERLLNEFLEDELIPDVLIEAIEDEKEAELDRRSQMKKFLEDARHYRDDVYVERENPVENSLKELIDDTVWEESFDVVNDAIKDLVDVHMEKAASYDVIMDVMTEILDADGPDIVRESIFDVILEDLIIDELIDPEIEDQGRDVALETVKHYNNKVRKKEIRQVEKDTGDKLQDSFSLDYLLSLIARQSNTWTEGVYADKALDRGTVGGREMFVSTVTDAFLSDTEDTPHVIVGGRKPITTDVIWDWMLTILLEQFLDVGRKRTSTVDNKPLRRHHEKVVTDVALDCLLGEMCQSLDEDMGDLDEYETGLDDPENFGTPEHIEKFFAGRR